MRSGKAPRGLKVWAERLYGTRRRAAYTMVSLAIIFTLMNIAVAAAMPAWSHMVQHDNEEELIFRGLQYAEAIRVFQIRFGRFPTNLKELRETKPRCLRHLWKNPMQEDGRWALIPAGVGTPIPGSPGSGVPGVPGGSPGNKDDDEGRESTGFGAPQQGTPQVIWSEKLEEGNNLDFGTPRNNLPIRGVYSPSKLDAIHLYLGKESISEWQFTVELISSIQQGTPDNPAFVRPFPVEFIGKPFPPGVVPPIAQPSSNPSTPGGQPPGGQPGQQGLKPGGGSPFRGDDGSGRDLRSVPPDQKPGG